MIPRHYVPLVWAVGVFWGEVTPLTYANRAAPGLPNCGSIGQEALVERGLDTVHTVDQDGLFDV